MKKVDWRLVNIVALPAGIILGLILRKGFNRFLKYSIVMGFLVIVGVIVQTLSKENKKTNMFNAVMLTILITLVMYLIRQLV